MKRDLFPQPRPQAPSAPRSRHVRLSEQVWQKLLRYCRVKEGGGEAFSAIVADRLLSDVLDERLRMAERVYAVQRNQAKVG